MTALDASSFSFVHVADLHLDTPFDGVHEVAPAVATALREASLSVLDDIVTLALARDAAFVLIAGDVYDGVQRGVRAQLRFRDALQRLNDAGIPTFVVHGNHDPVASGWSALREPWPELVTVFPAQPGPAVPVVRDGTVLATVQGISYATPAVTENLARHFSRPEGPGLHVGLLHCNVAGVSDAHANYSPCTVADLIATGLDYLALGHVHDRRTLAEGHPWIVYPGNTQGRGWRRTELGAKGAIVARVAEGEVAGLEFVACDRVRFAEVAVALDTVEDLGGLADALEEIGHERLAQAEGRSLLVRARLVGSGPLHDDLRRPTSLEELLGHLRERFAGAEPFVWWDELVDASTAVVDLDELRRRNDFTADLLALGESLEHDDEACRALFGEIASEAPRAFAAQLAALLDDPARRANLARAATFAALDAVSGADG